MKKTYSYSRFDGSSLHFAWTTMEAVVLMTTLVTLPEKIGK